MMVTPMMVIPAPPILVAVMASSGTVLGELAEGAVKLARGVALLVKAVAAQVVRSGKGTGRKTHTAATATSTWLTKRPSASLPRRDFNVCL